MPRAWARAGATGDAGGAARGKERSTEAQTNNCEGLRWGKKRRTTQSRTDQSEAAILRSAYSVFSWIPPVVRRLFEVNSEPHTDIQCRNRRRQKNRSNRQRRLEDTANDPNS